jgi:hypothetical protein
MRKPLIYIQFITVGLLLLEMSPAFATTPNPDAEYLKKIETQCGGSSATYKTSECINNTIQKDHGAPEAVRLLSKSCGTFGVDCYHTAEKVLAQSPVPENKEPYYRSVYELNLIRITCATYTELGANACLFKGVSALNRRLDPLSEDRQQEDPITSRNRSFAAATSYLLQGCTGVETSGRQHPCLQSGVDYLINNPTPKVGKYDSGYEYRLGLISNLCTSAAGEESRLGCLRGILTAKQGVASALDHGFLRLPLVLGETCGGKDSTCYLQQLEKIRKWLKLNPPPTADSRTPLPATLEANATARRSFRLKYAAQFCRTTDCLGNVADWWNFHESIDEGSPNIHDLAKACKVEDFCVGFFDYVNFGAKPVFSHRDSWGREKECTSKSLSAFGCLKAQAEKLPSLTQAKSETAKISDDAGWMTLFKRQSVDHPHDVNPGKDYRFNCAANYSRPTLVGESGFSGPGFSRDISLYLNGQTSFDNLMRNMKDIGRNLGTGAIAATWQNSVYGDFDRCAGQIYLDSPTPANMDRLKLLHNDNFVGPVGKDSAPLGSGSAN